MDHIDSRPPARPSEFAARAYSFGAQAAAYAQHRPDYPRAALIWGLAPVLGRGRPSAVDLGAGTGKVTGGLLKLKLNVTAVEPDTAMLDELRRRFPTVTAHLGGAERIPLPDQAADAVFVGQALHWFDLSVALDEIARILRPGGVLVALWNFADDRSDWVSGFCQASETRGRSQVRPQTPDAHPEFSAFERNEFAHHHRRSLESLVAMVATHSHVLVKSPEERDVLLARVHDYLNTRPETALGDFDLPITTIAIRARRR